MQHVEPSPYLGPPLQPPLALRVSKIRVAIQSVPLTMESPFSQLNFLVSVSSFVIWGEIRWVVFQTFCSWTQLPFFPKEIWLRILTWKIWNITASVEARWRFGLPLSSSKHLAPAPHPPAWSLRVDKLVVQDDLLGFGSFPTILTGPWVVWWVAMKPGQVRSAEHPPGK